MRETTNTTESSRGEPAALPDGYWSAEQCREILDQTLVLHLPMDLSGLSEAEKEAVEELLAAGDVLGRLYEMQRHTEARSAYAELSGLHEELGESEHSADLLRLYQLYKGPIATTLDNRRVPFLPVSDEVPGRNVYPVGVERHALEVWLAEHPERRREIFDSRSVVRRATWTALESDLAILAERPELDALHPGLRDRLLELSRENAGGFYGVPYSVAYPDEMLEVSQHLWRAAELLDGEPDASPDFAAFLRHRARDLLCDDYEAGDAAWVRGSFEGLNAQVGCYETYDDELLGVKCFMSLSLLAVDRERTESLRSALASLQAIEDRLPYEHTRRVQDDIPVGVYRVIADFGQARGANTATILPNDSDITRKYGRTILMRHNLLTEPRLFELVQNRFRTALAPEFHEHLTLEANFQRVLWHEIGHYLGVDRTEDGRDLDEALAHFASLCEELKADLASLFAAGVLHEDGHLTADELRSFYASGVLRVLQIVEPRREQPYQTMQLMQWNYYLDRGAVSFDRGTGRLAIDYERLPAAVNELLGEVLAVQRAGDPGRAASFVDRWAIWREDLHGVLAGRLREASPYRFVLVDYEALHRPLSESADEPAAKD